MELFRHLTLADWRQFDEVDINFHPQLTVLTGANGAGKTTLLSILGMHFNWGRNYVRVPLRQSDGSLRWSLTRRSDANPIAGSDQEQIGELTYASGLVAPITIPMEAINAPQYGATIQNQQAVSGMYLSSHRTISQYAQVTSIPVTFTTANSLFQEFSGEVRQRSFGSSQKTPTLRLKEALIAAANFGEGNSSVEPNPEAQAIWTGFQSILASILPATLGFVRLLVRLPEIVMETRSGDFLLDEASGGLSATIELAWQIFLQSRAGAGAPFVVVFDEPENHLHPSLQRRLLPDLLAAFPNAQFVVATHSPFVVTAVRDASVIVLDYSDPTSGRVRSQRLDPVNRAANADAILRQVLGLESTLPLWAQAAFTQAVERHTHQDMTAESLIALRDDLSDSGLADQFPEAVHALGRLARDLEPHQ